MIFFYPEKKGPVNAHKNCQDESIVQYFCAFFIKNWDILEPQVGIGRYNIGLSLEHNVVNIPNI